MIHSLDDEQRKKAIIRVSTRPGNYNLAKRLKTIWCWTTPASRGDALKPAQKDLLLDLVELYVGNMDDGHARVKIDEVKRASERNVFRVDWRRQHRQRFLLPRAQPGDPDRVRPSAASQSAAASGRIPTCPAANTSTAVVRTPNGNDYGKDLLRQHYLMFPHSN